MHARFDTMRGIERVLIRGKLDQARDFARTLSTGPELPFAPWAAQVALVRERAAAVATATGIDDACRKTARLAEACANCHAQTGAQILFRKPPPLLADQPDVVTRMVRHQWAADRIWEGMVGDASEPWRAGLDVMAAAPLAWPKIGPDRVGLAQRLQQLADQGRHTSPDDRAERARLYGELLVTCAACHSAP